MPKYMLKTVNEDMTAYGGFVWPDAGEVVAPDWSPNAECGNGLHGALSGEGDGRLFNWSADARWLVCEIADDTQIVDLDGKVKVECCTVIHCGDRASATNKMVELGCTGPLIGGTSTAGHHGMAATGDGGTSTADHHGMAATGDGGTATAGKYGTAATGDGGTALAGDYGTALAGDYGTATAGDGGTATAGNGGTATAGNGGLLNIKWYDCDRYRLAVGYIGEDGLGPNVPYVVKKGKFIRADAA